jgi:hypothetical protein
MPISFLEYRDRHKNHLIQSRWHVHFLQSQTDAANTNPIILQFFQVTRPQTMWRIFLVSVTFGVLFVGNSWAYGGLAANAVSSGSSLRRRQYGAMGHGAYGVFDGVEYRWQQIYQDTWLGVEPSVWDDTINAQNDAPAPWYPAPEPVNSTSNLTERDLVAGLCRAGNACLSATQNTVYNIGTAATQFFTNLAQQQGVKAVLNALSKPIVQKVIIGMSPIPFPRFQCK